jgi:mRNA-degrading endonuclease RelE of RelBE toxin-antitoxin system
VIQSAVSNSRFASSAEIFCRFAMASLCLSVERLTDAEYRELQTALILQPELGDLIPNTGGIRKLRWSETGRGKGKRGGVRVIYYWYTAGSLIYFLHIYSKSEQDLSDDEKKALRKLVAQEFK